MNPIQILWTEGSDKVDTMENIESEETTFFGRVSNIT